MVKATGMGRSAKGAAHPVPGRASLGAGLAHGLGERGGEVVGRRRLGRLAALTPSPPWIPGPRTARRASVTTRSRMDLMPVKRATFRDLLPRSRGEGVEKRAKPKRQSSRRIQLQSVTLDTQDRFQTKQGGARTEVPVTASEIGAGATVETRASDTGPRLTENGEPLVTQLPRSLSAADVERNPAYQAWDGTPPSRGKGWYERWRSPSNPDKWAYNYTEAYRNAKAGKKFAANARFAAVLPALKRRYAEDLRKDGMPQILALAVALIDQACFRVGNEDSMELAETRDPEDRLDADDDGGIYGLTTLKGKHLELDGDVAVFTYYGKHRQRQEKRIRCSPLIKKLLERLAAACPTGEEQLLRAGDQDLKDAHLRRYLKPFKMTPKQFRTFHASQIALQELLRSADAAPEERGERVMEMARVVQAILGHESPQMSLQHYIDPAIVAAFEAGEIESFAQQCAAEIASHGE